MSECQVVKLVEQAGSNSAKKVVRLLPDLDNVFQELGQLKSLLDSDINIDIKVRKAIVDVFQDGLELFCVNVHHDPASITQDIPVKCRISQSYFNLAAALRAREGDGLVSK